MMYKTELIEEITVENVTDKINKNIRNGKRELSAYNYVILGTERAVLVFKKGLKGSLL